jgi:hypothetical protein
VHNRIDGQENKTLLLRQDISEISGSNRIRRIQRPSSVNM